ncbi:hypothetical protein [Nisaea denitrificans]|uniref:hypothetical protein n=1 Tax=Nisaea denitrificans TaxID=390877 RepID=UPI00146FC45E|nr:hypothetical protein [Nisaea denitrificans]
MGPEAIGLDVGNLFLEPSPCVCCIIETLPAQTDRIVEFADLFDDEFPELRGVHNERRSAKPAFHMSYYQLIASRRCVIRHDGVIPELNQNAARTLTIPVQKSVDFGTDLIDLLDISRTRDPHMHDSCAAPDGKVTMWLELCHCSAPLAGTNRAPSEHSIELVDRR